ncbi:MAG TPA: copper resistance CopC family protein [Acidobacteriaceae bacterium]|nr:copper resistance CopC family protein [Acidobacteriaceae bacterium]
MKTRQIAVACLLACAALLLPRVALAHAHLLTSTPAANAAVHGPDIAIDLKFNSRVEVKGSMIVLVLPGGKTQRLNLDAQSNEVSLDAHAHLAPGSYTLRWQALSTDGHITRGEIPFTVR